MYRRIVLKLSGEALAPKEFARGECATYDENRLRAVAHTLKRVGDTGLQLGVVFGGGNIWRGRLSDEMNPVNADQMGMLATIINAIAAQDYLERAGAKATVFTAQPMPRFAELYRADKAIKCLEDGGIALLAGGTGNPFFTTDTGACLRAAELNADAVFKGTTVEGVYDSNPRVNKDAKLLKDVTYSEAIQNNYNVMDLTAFQICLQQRIPEIRVFNMDDLENIERVARGEDIGSRVHE